MSPISHRRLLGLLSAGVLAAQAPAAEPSLSITALDVEGGAATLYVTPEGKSLLIDAAWPKGIGGRRPTAGETLPPEPSSADKIVAAARKAGLGHLDYLLLTHYHVDHVGGVPELAEQIPISTFLDHGPNRETSAPDTPVAWAVYQPQALYPQYEKIVAQHKHRALQAGDTLAIGSLQLMAVTSDRAVLAKPLPGAGEAVPECATMTDIEADGGEENPRSLGVLLTFGKARIVSLGDLTWNVERQLVCPVDRVGKVDLFFVSNHGTKLNNSPALLHALSPRVVIMGNGAMKGGDPETFDTVMGTPSVQGFWAVHVSERAGADHNPPPAHIANLSATDDLHLPLQVAITRSGTITVTNTRTGGTERYPPGASHPEH